MLFDKPMVLHSKQADGRHWLTTIDMPPLQIWPVAPNHCRAGHFLATVIAAKLSSLQSDIPEEITLTRADVASVASLSSHYPEVKAEAGDVQIRLIPMKGPGDSENEPDDDGDPLQFITPQPPLDWTGNYDDWMARGRAANSSRVQITKFASLRSPCCVRHIPRPRNRQPHAKAQKPQRRKTGLKLRS